MWSGLPQLFLIPFVPKLMQRFDARFIAAVGFSLFAISCFMNSQMTHDTGIEQLRWSQLVRAAGQPALLVSGFTLLLCKKVKPGAGAAAH